MNGKNHELLSITSLIIFLSLMGLNWLFNSSSILFIALWLIGTYYITCDLDTKSRSRKRLGILGWAIDTIFGHRGTLHNVWFWAFIGIIGYLSIGFSWIGLIIPQGLHITSDWISTGVKRAF